MSSDKRKQTRKDLAARLALVDINSGMEIGDLANISRDGFMVLARRPLPAQSVFQLALSLPMLIRGVDTLSLGAESLWCNPTEDGEHYWVGFHVIDIAPQDQDVLDQLLASL